MSETPLERAQRAERMYEKCAKRGGGSMADVETLRNDVKALAAEYYVLEKQFSEYRREVEMERALLKRHDLRRLLIKAAPDRDLYVAWSMVSDGPTGSWTREEALAYGFFPEWLDKADATGSSSAGSNGHWDDPGFVVEGYAWLDRSRVGDYAVALKEGRTADAEAMLEKEE